MNKTGIDYLDFTWNPMAMRCTKVSPACDNCWHLRMANRLAKNPMIKPEIQAAYAGKSGPMLIKSRIDEPLRRKKSAMIGVQFMGDLFHDDVPEDFIWRVIEIAWTAKQHTFQILTKRPARMLDVLTRSAWWNNDTPGNIWLGVTAENQQTADERIPLLLQTLAAVRFVSAEPLLGPIDLVQSVFVPGVWDKIHPNHDHCLIPSFTKNGKPLLDPIITGGEAGPGARPMHPDWARGIRDQCQAAGVSCFHKHNGEWIEYRQVGAMRCQTISDDRGLLFGGSFDGQSFPLEYIGQSPMLRVGSKHSGHLLDGRAWREMPEVTK